MGEEGDGGATPTCLPALHTRDGEGGEEGGGGRASGRQNAVVSWPGDQLID